VVVSGSEWCKITLARSASSGASLRSPSRNFEVTDDRLWLYLVEMPLRLAATVNGCRVGADRRLVRMPLRWPAAADED
jgi:hypothetical protein